MRQVRQAAKPRLMLTREHCDHCRLLSKEVVSVSAATRDAPDVPVEDGATVIACACVRAPPTSTCCVWPIKMMDLCDRITLTRQSKKNISELP